MVSQYILQMFPLICVAIVMIVLAIQNRKSDPFISTCFLAILTTTLLLSVLILVETEAVRHKNVVVATLATYLGYAIRPFCLYAFLVLPGRQFKKREVLGMIPLFLNVLVYASCFFFSVPELGHLSFYYEVGHNSLIYVRGPLNFTSHIMCGLYLLVVVYISLKALNGKHRYDAISVLICAAFIVAAVIIEMTTGTLGILNMMIGVSCVFYYLFLLKEANRRDALTGLFDRKTFYQDLERMDRHITGVIQVDMNGLKTINDSQGHVAGDNALKKIGHALENYPPKNYYGYRMGGDEFTLLEVRGKPGDLPRVAETIRKDVAAQGYSCSIGFCARENNAEPIEETARKADEAMYRDKGAYYASHPELNRRGSRK